jgi:polyhydroxybutyrate depolymerase
VRTVVIHIPYRYDGNVETPVVLDLHGTESTAADEERLSAMDEMSDASGFIVVYPQGSIPAGSGFDWNIPGEPLDGGVPVPATAPDDVAFLYNLIVQLPNDYCVNTRRVFVTGFSDGARMASQLACEASTVVAAVAPVDGLRFPTPCASVRKVPVIAFFGTDDRVDPYNGNGQAYWTYSVPEAARRWAANNGCAATPTITQPSAGVSLSAYGGCITSSSIELYTITGMGHQWPDGRPVSAKMLRSDGPQSSAIDADRFIWDFFVYHAIPNPGTTP